MIALAYLACLTVALVVLAVALRPRRVPAPPTPPATGPAAVAVPEAEVRQILAAAARLAHRLDTAA